MGSRLGTKQRACVTASRERERRTWMGVKGVGGGRAGMRGDGGMGDDGWAEVRTKDREV